MSKETIEFETPNGHKVVIKSYVSGRTDRAITKVFLKGVVVSTDKDKRPVAEFQADAVSEAEEKAIEMLVVSLDGEKENVLDKVLDLDKDDTQSIVNKINEITEAKKKA